MEGGDEMRDVVTSAVRPLLLGCGKVARRTAWRFFAEYSVTSTVLDRRRTFGSYFSLFFSFGGNAEHFKLGKKVNEKTIWRIRKGKMREKRKQFQMKTVEWKV